jgi:hypothetical protein
MRLIEMGQGRVRVDIAAQDRRCGLWNNGFSNTQQSREALALQDEIPEFGSDNSVVRRGTSGLPLFRELKGKPMNRMDAEIVAEGDGSHLIEKLSELGFEMEVIHWLPEAEYGTTILAATLTELDVDEFFEFIESVVPPFNAPRPNSAIIIEAGMVQKPSALRAPGSRRVTVRWMHA